MRQAQFANEKRQETFNNSKGQEDSIFSKPIGFAFGPENTIEKID